MSRKFVMSRKSMALIAATTFGVATVAAATSAQAGGRHSTKVLKFESMVGNPRPFTGTNGAIRGVNAGGAPWAITAAHGELKANGELEVEVTGLVLDPNDPALVANGLAGTVPAAVLAGGYKAVVSCLSTPAAGTTAFTTVNVSTAAFPVDAAGNAEIEAKVDLPKPCFAPIVFVTSAGGAWFATTGA